MLLLLTIRIVAMVIMKLIVILQIKKFKSLVKLLPKNAYIYSSPLSRAIKTFQVSTREGLRYKFFFEDKRLKEQNIGKFAGMKYQDLYKLTKKLKIYSPNWLMNEKYIPDGGESLST